MPGPSVKQLELQFKKDFESYMSELGSQTLDIATKTSPINTGDLRRSAKLTMTRKGFLIKYNVPYAYQVHQGQSQKTDQQYVMQVPRHPRRLPSGEVTTVKAHTKTFKPGFKPIRNKKRNLWYTKDFSTNARPRPWLQKAWEQVYKKQPKELQEILPKKLRLKQTTVTFKPVGLSMDRSKGWLMSQEFRI